MITTYPHDQWPQIEWEIGDELDNDPDERMVVFNAAGSDSEGNNYSASAYFFAGIFEQMEDIERL